MHSIYTVYCMNEHGIKSSVLVCSRAQYSAPLTSLARGGHSQGGGTPNLIRRSHVVVDGQSVQLFNYELVSIWAQAQLVDDRHRLLMSCAAIRCRFAPNPRRPLLGIMYICQIFIVLCFGLTQAAAATN